MRLRVEKLRNSMKIGEAALISSYPNIFYYSGFTSGDGYLLISQDKSILITDSRYTIQAKKQAEDFEIVDIQSGWENIFKMIDADFIGYEENHITVKQYWNFCSKIGSKELIEMQKIINEPRRIKDETEIKTIAEAEHIGDEAFSYILERIHAGMTEHDVALDIEFFMKKLGASALSFETISASGIRSAMPHGVASDKILEKGDFLTLDFGCVYNGYCSDMTRTIVIGKASDRQREIYNIVLKAQQEALNALSSGKRCDEIDAVARKIISEAGYSENFGHALGHSVGIEIHENPSLSPKCQDLIEPGNVLTIEPGIYIEGFGGVRIEDLAVITDNGIRNLTFSPKQLIEIS